jgi:hypothetical protein
MERFVDSDAADYYGEHGAWWVHERLVEMAGVHATLDLLPALGLRLCDGVGGKAITPVGLFARGALTSMLALLGQDEPLILDERGALAVEQAARWIDACDVSCPVLDSGR